MLLFQQLIQSFRIFSQLVGGYYGWECHFSANVGLFRFGFYLAVPEQVVRNGSLLLTFLH